VIRVLAIDIGTSSIRATVYGENLRPLRHGAQVHYRWRLGSDGSVEAAPATIERAVAQAIDGALADVRTDIDAVAVAAFWHSLLGADRHGRPVTAVLPWSDTRSAQECETLRAQLDERAVHARTGCRLHSSYWAPRLLWFRNRDPKTFRRVQRWMSFPTYLERRWLGRDAESRSHASGTGMFVHDGCAWDRELCDACGVTPPQLGRVIDLADTSGEPSAIVRRRWPQLRNARWIPPAGDGALNNLGAGCTATGRAALMIGTSAALRQMWTTDTAPTVPFGLFRYWLDARRVVIGGAMSNGGNFVAWMRQTFGLEQEAMSAARLDGRISRVAPDSHGLTVLPFLAGERSPDYPSAAAAAIAGLRLATTRNEIARAGLESVAYRFLSVLEELIKVAPVSRITATGTALTSSRVWPQILADVLGRPTALPRDGELTSRGAALLGFEQLGVSTTSPDPSIARVVHPDARMHAVYRAAADRQQRMLQALHAAGLC
jgi:gluconokinase